MSNEGLRQMLPKLPGVIEQGWVTEAERDAGNLRF
jgi:hypothetical protein